MAGGPGNPLGARAMYLGSSDYRIHGTNDPSTIGKFVSSGCIRLTNEDVSDLFSRVNVGTKVVVLPKNAPIMARGWRYQDHDHGSSGAAHPRPAVTTLPSGRQAMNLTDAAQLSASSDEEMTMGVQIGKNWRLAAAALLCASALAPAAQAQDFFSALFGGIGARGRRSPTSRCRLPMTTVRFRRRAARCGRAMAAAVRRFACAPATAAISRSPRPTMPAGRRPATASVRPARPRSSTAATSTAPRPKTASPIRNCRMRSAIAPRSWRAAPATARTRPAWRRSRSRTIRRLRKGDIVAGENGLVVAGRGADKRGASLNFSPASERVRAKYERVPVVASE